MAIGRFKKGSEYYDIDTSGVYDSSKEQSQAAINQALSNGVDDLKSALSNDLDDVRYVEDIISNNFLNRDDLTPNKYVEDNGKLGNNSSYTASGYCEVVPGITYTVQGGDTTLASYRSVRTINQIAAYDKNKTFIPGSYVTYKNSYTAPDNSAFVMFSLESVYMSEQKYPALVPGTTVVDFQEYAPNTTRVIVREESFVKNGVTWDFDINSNNWTSDVEFQHMCAYSIMFRADITTFNAIQIGKGYNTQYGATLKIDTKKVYIYEGARANPTVEEAHNLTFADYIGVIIESNYGNVAKFTIYTNGGVYTKPYAAWDARKGKFFVRGGISTNVLTGCHFGYYCYALEKPTYIYGDSYLTNAQGVTDRWPAYLIAGSHRNYLLNGYPGRGSVEALSSLKTDLKFGIPQRIIWAMGMNNKDSADAINTDWKNCVDELMTICDDRGIELILATIPNTPSPDQHINKYKNEYVKDSGYRYIDFALAVNAEEDDDTWYTGMLSSDSVHPAIQGAIALYNQAIADAPELMS